MQHNYFDTFISVSEDSLALEAKAPQPQGTKKTVAQLHFERLCEQPYRFTQEEILFDVWLVRQEQLADLSEDEQSTLREQFFSKGQPCLRTSPLAKSYGWGIRFDAKGRAAAYPVESDDYRRHANDPSLTQLKAMRSRRAP